MKKFLKNCTALVMATVLLASCGGGSENTTSSGSEDNTSSSEETAVVEEGTQTLKVWSFTNEGKTFATAFEGERDDVNIEYTMIPMTDGEFQTKLQQTLANGSDVPDVVFLEASFLRQYVESPFLEDLSDLMPKAEAANTYQFTVDAATDFNGEIKGFSYQATPGAVFYRRSLAKEYFGTDNAEEIQEMMSDFDKYTDMAKVVKEKSNGDTYMVGSTGDFLKPYMNNRENPWIVDNTLVIDDKVEELFNNAKLYREEGYEAQATQWADGWFAGMNDSLVGADGNPKQVFTYWLPTWGLPYVLMQNSSSEVTDTAGDWGMVTGPLPYQWGGTWLSIPKNATNKDLAREFIEFATLNEETLTNWATGVYTNEYLTNINPDVADLFQGAGDFVSSDNVVSAISDQFNDAETSAFVGGQNAYEFFKAPAKEVDLSLMQGTDDIIERAGVNDQLESYVSGQISYEEAMEGLKIGVQTVLPDLIIE